MLPIIFDFGGSEIVIILFVLAVFFILNLLPYYKVFEKAGQPGWTALIPIYNIIILMRIIKKPEWWFELLPGNGATG